MFAFALSQGLEPAVRSFSITNHISAAAWPTAMVLMALCEVGARLSTVYLRTTGATSPAPPSHPRPGRRLKAHPIGGQVRLALGEPDLVLGGWLTDSSA